MLKLRHKETGCITFANERYKMNENTEIDLSKSDPGLSCQFSFSAGTYSIRAAVTC